MQCKINLIFCLFIFCFLFNNCNSEPNYKSLPAISAQGILAVIEIPAGTNKKVEYKMDRSRFEIDVKDGKKRVIDFLPYPGNYGFIPSTLMDEDKGGDGDALDIMVISESLQTGDTISVIPIAALLLDDSGEIDTKIIAVPADPTKRVMQVTDFQTFTVKYNMAQKIIENWFLNYKGLGVTKFIGWRNDRFAMQEIEKWKEEE